MANYKAKKAGQTLAAQKKLEEKYDAEETQGTPTRIVEWMNEVLGSDHTPCPNAQWRKMQFWMRDGVVVCKLINKMREAASLPAVKYVGNAHVPLAAQNNIDAFVKAAIEYGVPESASFVSLDLYEAHKGTFYNVILFLNKLGNEGNKKGFSPKYKYVEPTQNNDVHT